MCLMWEGALLCSASLKRHSKTLWCLHDGLWFIIFTRRNVSLVWLFIHSCIIAEYLCGLSCQRRRLKYCGHMNATNVEWTSSLCQEIPLGSVINDISQAQQSCPLLFFSETTTAWSLPACMILVSTHLIDLTCMARMVAHLNIYKIY